MSDRGLRPEQAYEEDRLNRIADLKEKMVSDESMTFRIVRLEKQRDDLLEACKLALPILAREWPLGASPTYKIVEAAIRLAEEP